MELVIEEDDGLPRLAWCAAVREGAASVVVRVGPRVDHGAGWFAEGVWNGPFGGDDFVSATVLCGSGGRLTAEGLELSSSNGPFDLLAVARREGGLWISNSPVFAVTAAGDAPDFADDRCYERLHRLATDGVGAPSGPFRMAGGTEVILHQSGVLVVDAAGGVVRRPRPELPLPLDPAAYRDLLVATLVALRTNGADQRRRHPFGTVSTISSGFDSTCASALAAAAGWREAMTLRDEDQLAGADDSGAEVAGLLGLDVAVVGKRAWRRLPGFPEAELAAVKGGHVMLGFAGAAPVIEGAIVVTGVNGGPAWGDDVMHDEWATEARFAGGNAGAASLLELRLRTGSVLVSPAVFGARSLAAIDVIKAHPALAAYDLGTGIERPFARFVLEGSGIPRALVRARKIAGSNFALPEALKEASRSDALELVAARHPGGIDAARAQYAAVRRRRARELRVLRRFDGVPGVRRRLDRQHAPWWRQFPGPFLYHWGVERTADRYR